MPYWIYSSESLPNPELSKRPGYSPEIFEWGYVTLPAVVKEEWIPLHELFARQAGSKEHAAQFRNNADGLYTMRHRDWKDKAGTREFIPYSDLSGAIRARWGIRGVVVLNHEPSQKEKDKIAEESKDANMAFRMRAVEDYEERIKQRAVGEKVSTRVTPYEDECYTVLGLTKPYSVEALRAQRHPGESVGEQIVAALERRERRLQKEQPQPAR